MCAPARGGMFGGVANMTTLLDILFLLAAAGGGAGAVGLVWVLRWRAENSGLETDEARFARDTLAKLQDLTRRVAADVDHHAECVEVITAQLTSDDNDEEAVVAAVSQLVDANRRMQRQLDSAEERLQAQAVQMESHAVEARTDALTHVANRRALDDELARCVTEFRERGTISTFILWDVDHFKRFNDSHGHQSGDEALRTVAHVVRRVLDEDGMVARYGGEEFAAVLAGSDSVKASQLCERVRQAIEATPVRAGGRELRITASAGVAQLLANETEQDLVARADEALYASKKAGRNCGHLHDGRTSRLIRFQEPVIAAAIPPLPERGVGDEWLFEQEANSEAIFQEPLANVSSRASFFDEVIRRMSQCRRTDTPLTMLMIQVDSYDRVIADHGPTCGGVVLRVMSQFINASLREMDSVSRLNDDTFSVLLPGAVLDDGLAIAQRLRQAVERCRLPRKAGVKFVTLSAGVVQASETDDLRHILERARDLLNQAAIEGRNCVVGEQSAAARLAKQAANSEAPVA
jgi:diguanylate cyclase